MLHFLGCRKSYRLNQSLVLLDLLSASDSVISPCQLILQASRDIGSSVLPSIFIQ